MKLPPTMPSTTPIKTSTTRISIRVIPDSCLRDRFIFILQRPYACSAAMLSRMFSSGGADRIVRQVSADEFAHPHHAEQDREHDSADQHGETEDHRRLEDREEALDGDLHLAVVDVRDADQHFFQTAAFLADHDQLRRKAGIDAALTQRAA